MTARPGFPDLDIAPARAVVAPVGLIAVRGDDADPALDGVRHQYRFEIDDEGVVGESLFDLPGARRRRLLLRDSTGTVKLHPDLGSVRPVAKRELVLSRALQLGRGGLEKIAGGLLGGVMVLPLGEDHRRIALFKQNHLLSR